MMLCHRSRQRARSPPQVVANRRYSGDETTSSSYEADNADASSVLSTQTPPTTTTPSSQASPVVTYPPPDKRVIADGQSSAGDLACYARAPYPGECWIDLYGPSIAEDVDENTVYWSELCLYDKSGHVFAGDVVHTEAKRLAALGYEIYVREDYWTGYWGEEKHVTHLCGYFTKEHLEQFPSSDGLGYMIDYSREDVAACERVLP